VPVGQTGHDDRSAATEITGALESVCFGCSSEFELTIGRYQEIGGIGATITFVLNASCVHFHGWGDRVVRIWQVVESRIYDVHTCPLSFYQEIEVVESGIMGRVSHDKTVTALNAELAVVLDRTLIRQLDPATNPAHEGLVNNLRVVETGQV